MSFVAALLGAMVALAGVIAAPADLEGQANLADRLTPAVQVLDVPAAAPPSYEPGRCGELEQLFRWWGATDAEVAFFFGERILWRETRCGLDNYNERTGDTGVCQLTHLHSKPGWFFGQEWGEGGWTWPLFGIRVGSAHRGAWAEHPSMPAACLWLLRGGSHEPGTIFRQPWRPQR